MKHSHDFDFKLQFTKTGRPYIIVDNFLTHAEYLTVMNELDTIIRPNMVQKIWRRRKNAVFVL